MLRRLRRRVSYANVTATMALFVALGGTAAGAAYVVSKNSQLGPNTVSGGAPPKGKHANLIEGSIASADIKAHAIGAGRLAPSALSPIAYGVTKRGYGVNVCQGDNFCELSANKNITSVRTAEDSSGHHPGGDYCIRVAGIHPSHAHPAIAGPLYPTHGSAATAGVPGDSTHALCEADEYEVLTGNDTADLQSYIGFWIVVL
ncbi:MAG TPA: hypothetical protein VJT75_02535 [Thermoleophilaceae bacterium]|nr:hypothetical protein [Thermoleophilaceae bacterium]